MKEGGTQLKLMITFSDEGQALFKPMRYVIIESILQILNICVAVIDQAQGQIQNYVCLGNMLEKK